MIEAGGAGGTPVDTLNRQVVTMAFFPVQWRVGIGWLNGTFSFPTSAQPLGRENAGLSRSRRQGGDFPEKCLSFQENTTRFLIELQAMVACIAQASVVESFDLLTSKFCARLAVRGFRSAGRQNLMVFDIWLFNQLVNMSLLSGPRQP